MDDKTDEQPLDDESVEDATEWLTVEQLRDVQKALRRGIRPREAPTESTRKIAEKL